MAIPVTGIAGPGVPQFAYYYIDENKKKVNISKSQYEELKKSGSAESALERLEAAIRGY